MRIHKLLALSLFSLLFLFVACSDDNPDDMQNEEMPSNMLTECDEDPFGIILETPNVTLEQDSSWLTFYDGPDVGGDRLGYLGWDYPTWMGSNDIVFSYPNEGLMVGEFEIVSVGGVLYFDGTGGTMLVCPCDAFVLEITHLDKEQGYCCGTVSGKATNQDNALVTVEGEFKAFLDGE